MSPGEKIADGLRLDIGDLGIVRDLAAEIDAALARDREALIKRLMDAAEGYVYGPSIRAFIRQETKQLQNGS